MWPVDATPRGTLFVVVGAQRVECGVIQGRGRRARWIEETLQQAPVLRGASGEEAMQAVQIALQSLRACPLLPRIVEVRVVVADAWLALAPSPWSRSFKRASTAVVAARHQLADAGFDVDAADAIRVDDAPFEQPRLAVAYPAAMLAAFHDAARRLHARLTSVLPLSSVAWAVTERATRLATGSRQQAMAVLDDGLTLFACSQGQHSGRLSEVTVRREGGSQLTATDLSAAWRRLGLRDSRLNQVDKLAVLDLRGVDGPGLRDNAMFAAVSLPAGDGGSAGSEAAVRLTLAAQFEPSRHSLDAIFPPFRPSPWQWLMLGGVALMALTLGAKAFEVHRAREALSAQLSIETPVTRSRVPVAVWTRDELVRVQAVNGAIRELNLPIASILQALQPPRDIRVAVVSVDAKSASPEGQSTGGGTSAVKVVAEALSGADMARYVAFVGTRKPFTAAYLVGHEVNEIAPEKPYRFTMDAQWAER